MTLAFTLRTGLPSLGFIRSISSSFSTAFMNSSVIATDILKLLSMPSVLFAVIKSKISGWSYLRIPMFAPLRLPPCFIISVATSNTLMKESGPEAIPPVLLTTSFLGLRWVKENPVPPPVLCMSAVYFTASNISSIESPTGRTKHAASCWSSVPAFIRVGELGKNFREVMSSKNLLYASSGSFP